MKTRMVVFTLKRKSVAKTYKTVFIDCDYNKAFGAFKNQAITGGAHKVICQDFVARREAL